MAQSDIIFIQGIQDSEEKLHTNLLDSLNTYYEGTSGISNAYSVVASQRLGTSTLEQYAYYYRNDKVKLVHHYLYNDAGNDYPYDPMVAYFSPINGIGLHGDMQDFFIIGARTRASSATRSMTDKLVDVHADALTKFPLVTNGIILGDLFADCSYICASCFDAIRLWTDEQYTWIIDADTTTTASDCAFDRLVVTGNQMKTQTIAAVVDFKMMYNLNDSMARSVSTHFPVTMPICESNQV
ncbi:PREDICTED: deoxyribonuclease-1-like [Priapulus caudatus]|uniref:Deoxyribonuclease-1-like n=1 Tax=Priapulus caudatus TaxID=37621 RepID=A0ABM1FAP5_PRICU|nr:PREDICTED: deoxyribonuclease-1-like [Priapulus caudatus]